MSKWQAAYLGEKGMEIYQMAGQGKAELLYSGSLDGLKPVSGGIQRRILILGRSKVIRIRKHYPPMKMDKLLRAVEKSRRHFPHTSSWIYGRGNGINWRV